MWAEGPDSQILHILSSLDIEEVIYSPRHIFYLINDMVRMNVFRILGDVSHTASKCILIWAIHSNKSAEGERFVSLPKHLSGSDYLYK